jgi:hypothetical protein
VSLQLFRARRMYTYPTGILHLPERVQPRLVRVTRASLQICMRVRTAARSSLQEACAGSPATLHDDVCVEAGRGGTRLRLSLVRGFGYRAVFVLRSPCDVRSRTELKD